MGGWSWSISFGQVVLSVPVTILAYILYRILKMGISFRLEHEWLMMDWATRQNPPVKLADLITRQNKWWI